MPFSGSAKEIPPELKVNYGKILGVDADNGFKPLYVILPGKESVIKRLQKAQVSQSDYSRNREAPAQKTDAPAREGVGVGADPRHGRGQVGSSRLYSISPSQRPAV